MSIPRRRHSSCSLGNYIYAVCGYVGGKKIKYTNSIERLDVSTIGSKRHQWTQLETRIFCIEPRADPAVAAINENEIVILGGDIAPNKWIGDFIIINVNDLIAKKCKMKKGAFSCMRN